MPMINADDPLALSAVTAIRTGDLLTLRQLLADHPDLVTTRIRDGKNNGRTLLHVVTDWPGHFPNGPATVATLIAAGADVNGQFDGPHQETPLHWAASSDDVAVLDALLDSGADINWLATWEPATPLDAAERENADDVTRWLHDHGAQRASDLSGSDSPHQT